MTEADARDWIAGRHGAAAVDRLAALARLVADENGRQNLIAPSTIADIWRRHILDSVQLLAFDRPSEPWLDIGTGGGFPGLAVALLREAPVALVEPRGRRATFLRACIGQFGLRHVRVSATKVERWHEVAGIISARAVASLDLLFGQALHCATPATRWVLPKGRTAQIDLDEAAVRWQGMFHVEQSIVEPVSGIVIAEGVRRR